MGTKIIELDREFATGEPTVQLVATRHLDGARIFKDKSNFNKLASNHSPALEYIKTVEPKPGHSIVLVIGLGDWETYGPNRNGDGFPSQEVPGKVAANETLLKWFHTYDSAVVYQHHVNDDPAKGCGRVIKAFWNPFMRRVEVLEDLDHAKAPELAKKILNGEYCAKSMGARLKYDVCTVCGNKARTRGEYCDHLRFEMNHIYPDGKQACALNPSPSFFDSSWVIRPADRTGFMLKKVAQHHTPEVTTSSYELGDIAKSLREKAAQLRKAADIDKIVDGKPVMSANALSPQDAKLLGQYTEKVLPDATANNATLPTKVIVVMSSFKPNEALSTSSGMGMPLGMSELMRYFFGKLENDFLPAEDPLTKSAVAHTGVLLDLYSEYPRFFDYVSKLADLRVSEDLMSEKLGAELSQHHGRDIYKDYFSRQFIPEDWQERQAPLTDMVTYTDPNTKQQYQTTRGAVQRTNDSLVHSMIKRRALALGGSALLGAAGLATANPLALAATPIVASKGLEWANKPYGPGAVTDDGRMISGYTEMLPKNASSLPPELALAKILYVDKRGVPKLGSDSKASLMRVFSKCASINDTHPVLGTNLDFDGVSYLVGKSIMDFANNLKA